MINRENFFKSVKTQKLFTKITQSQVEGIEATLNEWENHPDKYTDVRWLSYMLATTFHETAKTMQPVEEYGHGKGHNYGEKIKRSGVAYLIPNQIYFGRGLVQLTWFENYENMGRLICIDLLNHPELALKTDVAIKIMFEGMTKGASSFGDFTGKCLEMYFNTITDDPVGARKIINGKDKAELIAGYHKKFLIALTA